VQGKRQGDRNMSQDDTRSEDVYEIEAELKHEKAVVTHGEYDSDTEELFDKLEALEREVAELKRQIEALKVKL
jgi:uncharacterized protein YceH (UPF0502 family)